MCAATAAAAPPNVRRGDIKAKSATTSDFCRQRRMTPQLRPQLPPPPGATTARFRSVSSVGRSAAVTCRCAPPPLPPSTACRPSFPHYAVVGGIVRVASYSSHHILDPPASCLYPYFFADVRNPVNRRVMLHYNTTVRRKKS